ncbi:DedA family protein [Paenibacillus protaetiae]|uniref:DedA family protein n=1 Tax=Paenibacillus protaetiae TaxID=2509456 RepID=A0A4P6ESZ9_9BACL|nr:DedA family protein [Paenibacillus protaetiae]QAY65706.1 DedA family protein [Paenibacillus protaetiae]
MGYDLLLSIINTVGYAALFIVLCLGLIGLPIPNEVVVMTGGALAASGLLSAVPAFIATWLGICSAMTFNYSIGRFAGNRLFNWFNRKPNMAKFLDKADQMIHRFGGYAVMIGLLLPFVRHAMPFVIGSNKTRYAKFIWFAYPSAFVWTLAYFLIGSLVGDNLQHIGDLIYDYGLYIVIALAAAAAVYIGFRLTKAKKQKDAVGRDM